MPLANARWNMPIASIPKPAPHVRLPLASSENEPISGCVPCPEMEKRAAVGLVTSTRPVPDAVAPLDTKTVLQVNLYFESFSNGSDRSSDSPFEIWNVTPPWSPGKEPANEPLQKPWVSQLLFEAAAGAPATPSAAKTSRSPAARAASAPSLRLSITTSPSIEIPRG